MATPVLDEKGIIALLKQPVLLENIAAIQAGAVQALIDLYDREVTREEFTDSAGPCLALYGQCAKLWLLANIRDVYTNGNLDEARFKKAQDELVEVVRAQTEQIIDLVKRLQMCPLDEDKVH